MENGYRTEVEACKRIYDIIDSDGNIIEIQTKNLAKLLGKTTDALAEHRTVKIIYPLVIKKYITLYDKDGKQISHRKSPHNGCVYDLFNELTGLYSVLLKKGFTLEVLEITMCEQRIRTDELVQSSNGRRRYRKNWNKTNKILEDISGKRIFRTADDYLSLIPTGCLPEFCAKDISKALKTDETLPPSAHRQANLMLWVLSHMKLITVSQIKNRNRYYKIT